MTSTRHKKSTAGKSVRNEVRIIAGHWRGRRIQFPDAPGLRPTPDRVRETVFNWLQSEIPGARCPDMFAGSGALGFEAASRGASAVTLLERDPGVCRQLRTSAADLKAATVHVECVDAVTRLARDAATYDVVFLDPPFASDLLRSACHALAEHERLAPGAFIYMEASSDLNLSFLPPRWVITRSKRAGQVGYHLARFQAPDAP